MSKSEYALEGPDLEKYVLCPYDRAHRLLPTRLSWHLNRCSRNHPKSKMVRCPFNITHVHSVPDMQKHVIECPSRTKFENYVRPDKMPPVEPKPGQFVVESSEDWDNESPVKTYNPRKNCEQKFIIQNPQGAPPAARREFRERERRRFIKNDKF
ncbi:hypothetical protein KR009_012416 [Drosophila setifemur]|nr:hypothetical protein KR009_012416 [Drosophila setifemur]